MPPSRMSRFGHVGLVRHRAERHVGAHGLEAFDLQQIVLEELHGQRLVGAGGVQRGGHHPAEGSAGGIAHGGDRRHAEVDAALLGVGPGPGAADEHGRLALVEGGLGDAVVGALGHHPGVDQRLEGLRTLLGAVAVDPGAAGVIAAVVGGEHVATVGSQQRPGEVGVVVIPENGALAGLGQLGVEFQHLVEGGRRRRYQGLVVEQADGLDCHRVAPQLAAVGHRIPGKILDLVLGLGTGGDRRDQPALRPFAEAVVGPDEDVRAVAGGGGLLELVGGAVRVGHLHGDAGVGGEALADLGQALVALVAVDPDDQLAFLDGGLGRQGMAQGGGKADGNCAEQHLVHV